MYTFNIRPEYYLFSESEIESRSDCRVEELCGEEKVLNSKVIDDAFERIMEDYKPSHKNVIFSLCSATRPYIGSPKWKAFYKNFGDVADLVISSNGGIIPIEYMCCFPFMQYDAHRANSGTDELYKDRMKDKLSKFLNKFGKYWDIKVYSFLPTSRNAQAIKEMNGAGGFLVPSQKVYRDIIDNGCPGVNVKRFPQCATQHLQEIADILNVKLPTQIESVKQKELF